MRWRVLFRCARVVVIVAAGLVGWPSGGEAVDDRSSEALARDAVSVDPAIAEPAIEELRRRGREGHDALLRVHERDVFALRTGRGQVEAAERLRHAIDRVSAQRDGHASGLYWHTELELAQREARERGVPILSLRLLGRLDEELSCANSRFFRVVLYSDPEVAAHLRAHYVLHWSSERPAPRITIDMGDGRQIVRTITGNSIHYVLDASARPIDGIAGLYAPRAFLAALAESERAFASCGTLDGAARADCLARHHTIEGAALRERWAALTARDRTMPSFDRAVASLPSAAPSDAPRAELAMPLTARKMVLETPMLRAMGMEEDGGARPEREPDFARAGVLLHGAHPMSAEGYALLRLKLATRDVDRVAAELTRDALADGARNELLFRRRIHDAFTSRAVHTTGFMSMNAWVYRDLMLTPASDPWLGLQPDGSWDAVEDSVASPPG
jgi:hypothetical protein